MNQSLVLLLVIVVVLVIVLVVVLCCSSREKFVPPRPLTMVSRFGNVPVFKAPPSLTLVKGIPTISATKVKKEVVVNYTKEILDRYNKNRGNEFKMKTIEDLLDDISHHDIKGFHTKHNILNNLDPHHIHLEKGNLLSMPSFFDCRDKWPGCMPPPFYQGTCGSCWAFAISTCLSARFYIESCGNTGCNNYPQLNLESLDITMDNINKVYKFRKITFTGIHQYITKEKNIKIDTWLAAIKKAHREILEKGNMFQKYIAMQVMAYMLDYQSRGAIHFNSQNPQLGEILERAKVTFSEWSKDGVIDVAEWEQQWLSQPIPLSAEKIVSCCYPSCYDRTKSLFNLTREEILRETTPQCVGGTLMDGWKLVRDTGTTTTLCLGYNLDSWKEGEAVPNCHELQGPDYSYCSGFFIHYTQWKKEFNEILESSERNRTNPINKNQKGHCELPWKAPQLFRFRAQNAYEVNDDMVTIQKEIIERGPVTTGFIVYEDFQYVFGTEGMGGQYYREGDNPLGSNKNSLIYMWNGKGTQIGGHAITIVGWGTFYYKEKHKLIPYWICLNSWGKDWGTSGYPTYKDRQSVPNNIASGGYFWMVRGIDNCSIEKNVVAGQPFTSNISYPGTTEKYGWGLPYPNLKNVTLIPPYKNNIMSSEDLDIKIGPFYSGGGSYNYRIRDGDWEIKSMIPPSPFVFFWPDERPLYCLGKLAKTITKDIEDRTLYVNKETWEFLNEITQEVIHPIILLNDEQVQIVDIVENFGSGPTDPTLVKKIKTLKNLSFGTSKGNFAFKINRGLNNTIPQEHKVGSDIKIFPFMNLSMDKLEKYPRCPRIYTGTIEESGSSLVKICSYRKTNPT